MSDYALVRADQVNRAHSQAIQKVRDEAFVRAEQRRAVFEKRLQEEREHAVKMALREARAVVEIVKLGVTIGDTYETPEPSGCGNCIWHLRSKDGRDLDGAYAYVIETNLKNNLYGVDPKDCILYAVTSR